MRIEGLSKSFGGTPALRDVSFAVPAGTIHALLGGNGSGKSTMIKILAGVYEGEPGGSVTIGAISLASDRITPDRARALGLRFVHQNTPMFPDLSVTENLCIGEGFQTRAGRIRWRVEKQRARRLLERFEIDVRPETLMRRLRPAEQAMIAIARALQDQEAEAHGTLILDEPTAALPRAEVDQLMSALVRYAGRGQTIILVSHRLEEVLKYANGVTVLREGRVAGTVEQHQMSEGKLVELIAGRELSSLYPDVSAVRGGRPVLSVRDLRGGPLRGVHLELCRGEVLGVAGLLGSGRSELLKMLFGAYPRRGGTVELNGKPQRLRDVGDAIKAGLAYVPENRSAEASFPDMSAADNLGSVTLKRYWRGGWLDDRSAARDARSSMTEFLVHARSERQLMSTLSGGNQQKVILARWLRMEPQVLLLDEPTQGVDVNARAEIYKLVRGAVGKGCSVILVTSDFEELARACDRVIVLGRGRVTAEVTGADLIASRLTELTFSARKTAT